jgi:hypothetical protein
MCYKLVLTSITLKTLTSIPQLVYLNSPIIVPQFLNYPNGLTSIPQIPKAALPQFPNCFHPALPQLLISAFHMGTTHEINKQYKITRQRRLLLLLVARPTCTQHDTWLWPPKCQALPGMSLGSYLGTNK